MQRKWYADAKDIVKWGGLAHLCQSRKVGKLLYVMMYRDSKPFRLKCGDDREVGCCEQVWNHFRDLERGIGELEKALGIKIVPWDQPFVLGQHTTREDARADYFKGVCSTIEQEKRDGLPLAVFLDPDIGLEPPGGAEWEHVKGTEVQCVYDCLRKGDVLALFQHGPRNANGQAWKEDRQMRFARSVNLDRNAVVRCCSPDVPGAVLLVLKR